MVPGPESMQAITGVGACDDAVEGDVALAAVSVMPTPLTPLTRRFCNNNGDEEEEPLAAIVIPAVTTLLLAGLVSLAPSPINWTFWETLTAAL